jgi:hypothetical protein
VFNLLEFRWRSGNKKGPRRGLGRAPLRENGYCRPGRGAKRTTRKPYILVPGKDEAARFPHLNYFSSLAEARPRVKAAMARNKPVIFT